MAAEGVFNKYAIGGQAAASLHFETPPAKRVAILLGATRERGSLAEVERYLRGAGTDGEGGIFNLAGSAVQFVLASDRLEQEAVDQAVATLVDNVPTRVVSAEHCVALALAVSTDESAAYIMQFLNAGVLNTTKFSQILGRHNLLEAWTAFSRQHVRAGW